MASAVSSRVKMAGASATAMTGVGSRYAETRWRVAPVSLATSAAFETARSALSEQSVPDHDVPVHDAPLSVAPSVPVPTTPGRACAAGDPLSMRERAQQLCGSAHFGVARPGLTTPIASVSMVGEPVAVGGPHWRVLGELSGLDERTVRSTLTPKRYGRGEVVFHEGDPAGALHLIDRGRVAVRLSTPSGDVATIDVLGAGDTFGEQALVDGVGERTATVMAIEPTSTLMLGRADLARLRDERPTVDRFFVMVLSARLSGHVTSPGRRSLPVGRRARPALRGTNARHVLVGSRWHRALGAGGHRVDGRRDAIDRQAHPDPRPSGGSDQAGEERRRRPRHRPAPAPRRGGGVLDSD